MRKLAVFFPGIGYTVDKPLMHYSRRLAAEREYDIKLLPYTGFPPKIKGDRRRMAESLDIALRQTEDLLSSTDLSSYDSLLFIGKSIGTVIAARLAASAPYEDRIRLILYTPLEDTFAYPVKNAIVFTGADDPWVGKSDSRIPALCRERQLPCYVIPDANHSLESGDLQKDLLHMQTIMQETARFMDQPDPVSLYH